MDSNNEFFKTVDTSKKRIKAKIGFTRGIFIPFISGILGTTLVIGLCANVPVVKDTLANFLNITTLPFKTIWLVFVFSLIIVIVAENYKNICYNLKSIKYIYVSQKNFVIL